jgi:UDP-N-acetylmuramate dehydrogenase
VNSADIASLLPAFRGRLSFDVPLAPYTWFRVGGPADVLASPADEGDLAYLLSRLPAEIPITVIGVGSNLVIRDGGVRGVVIRLGGRAFGMIETTADYRVIAGAAMLDSNVAKAAAEAGIDGLAFLRGVPGAVGGALRMNAGAHGGEIKDILTEAQGFDREGRSRRFDNAAMGFSYRHSDVSDDFIFTRAVFQGRAGEREAIENQMERITAARESSQPIREKTGGSTFKNPPDHKAWELIDAAGCRGLVVGDAEVSNMHCNFLINRGRATAADIEALGEEVRRRVKDTSGVELQWEIKRVGSPEVKVQTS